MTAALRERVAEAARRMSALLVTDLSLEDVFASFCDLLGSFVGGQRDLGGVARRRRMGTFEF